VACRLWVRTETCLILLGHVRVARRASAPSVLQGMQRVGGCVRPFHGEKGHSGVVARLDERHFHVARLHQTVKPCYNT